MRRKPKLTYDQDGHEVIEESACERFARLINSYRSKKNLSQGDLATLLFVDRNSVANWESARSRPPLEVVPRLCELLSLPMETFFDLPYPIGGLCPEEQEALSLYHRLSPHDQTVIDGLIAYIHDSQQQRLRRRCMLDFVGLKQIDPHGALNPEKAAEGTGILFYVRRSPLTESATHVMVLEGDDMEPDFPEGCRVYVKKVERVRRGDIILVAVNGTFYVRKIGDRCLQALNPHRGDMRLHPSDHIKILGKVLGPVARTDLPGKREQNMLETIAWEEHHS